MLLASMNPEEMTLVQEARGDQDIRKNGIEGAESKQQSSKFSMNSKIVIQCSNWHRTPGFRWVAFLPATSPWSRR